MRAALLAFDSPDAAMIQRGIDAGEMPTMARLLEEGTYIALDDMQELITPPTWCTLCRGTHLVHHRLMCDRQLAPGSYRFDNATADSALKPPFWRYFSDAGLRSTIVSPYSAPLLESFRGTQVIGWGTPDAYAGKLEGPRSDPPGLTRTLEKAVGPRTLQYGTRLPRTEADYRRYVESRTRGAEQQTQALVQLLDETDWDFFFGAFSDCHEAGHVLWERANPEDPGRSADDALMRIYRATDAGLGEVIDRLPADTALFVASPYGMGADHGLQRALPDILVAGGWLARGDDGRPTPTVSPRLRALKLGRALVRRTVPAGLRPALGRLVPRERLLGELALAGTDWERTAAFPLWSDGGGLIRLNLAGRDPSGTVDPGAAYDELCAEITEALFELRHADTGEPVVARVERFDELFGAPTDGPFPDLCVQWRRLRPVRAVRSERLGTIAPPHDGPFTSVHTAPGFVIGRAPGIPASGSRRLDGASAGVADVAPTVMEWLGASPSEEISGEPIPVLAPTPGEAAMPTPPRSARR